MCLRAHPYSTKEKVLLDKHALHNTAERDFLYSIHTNIHIKQKNVFFGCCNKRLWKKIHLEDSRSFYFFALTILKDTKVNFQNFFWAVEFCYFHLYIFSLIQCVQSEQKKGLKYGRKVNSRQLRLFMCLRVFQRLFSLVQYCFQRMKVININDCIFFFCWSLVFSVVVVVMFACSYTLLPNMHFPVQMPDYTRKKKKVWKQKNVSSWRSKILNDSLTTFAVTRISRWWTKRERKKRIKIAFATSSFFGVVEVARHAMVTGGTVVMKVLVLNSFPFSTIFLLTSQLYFSFLEVFVFSHSQVFYLSVTLVQSDWINIVDVYFFLFCKEQSHLDEKDG